MRPSEFIAIRPCIAQAILDIGAFLDNRHKQENVLEEMAELYSQLKGKGKPRKISGAVYKEPLKGIRSLTPQELDDASEKPFSGPSSEEEAEAVQVAVGGRWQESSRQAAIRLRGAWCTGEADGIESELAQLPNKRFSDPDSRRAQDDVEQAKAVQVKRILTAWLKEEDAKAAVAGSTPLPTAKSEQSEGNGVKGNKPKRRKKRSDPKDDKRVADAYVTGRYRTEAACATALSMEEIDVHRARDRHRHRQSAKERPRKKLSQ